MPRRGQAGRSARRRRHRDSGSCRDVPAAAVPRYESLAMPLGADGRAVSAPFTPRSPASTAGARPTAATRTTTRSPVPNDVIEAVPRGRRASRSARRSWPILSRGARLAGARRRRPARDRRRGGQQRAPACAPATLREQLSARAPRDQGDGGAGDDGRASASCWRGFIDCRTSAASIDGALGLIADDVRVTSRRRRLASGRSPPWSRRRAGTDRRRAWQLEPAAGAARRVPRGRLPPPSRDRRRRELSPGGRGTTRSAPSSSDVLRVQGDRIAEITTFDATLFEAFGLPRTL